MLFRLGVWFPAHLRTCAGHEHTGLLCGKIYLLPQNNFLLFPSGRDCVFTIYCNLCVYRPRILAVCNLFKHDCRLKPKCKFTLLHLSILDSIFFDIGELDMDQGSLLEIPMWQKCRQQEAWLKYAHLYLPAAQNLEIFYFYWRYRCSSGIIRCLFWLSCCLEGFNYSAAIMNVPRWGWD